VGRCGYGRPALAPRSEGHLHENGSPPGSGDQSAHDYLSGRDERRPSGPECYCEEILGQIRAPDASGRYWAQPAARSSGVQVAVAANPRRWQLHRLRVHGQHPDQIPGRVIAVGHSYGGAVNSNSASMAKNIVGLVFVAAFAPDEGEQLGAVASGSKDSVLNTAQVSLRLEDLAWLGGGRNGRQGRRH
jgi:hypothetical protein